eukprot:GHVP01062031.1.p1 GENE.GHVP01062031.1~~GHVP01062031.1.p1  ORF type:complete len:367 (-),score=64.29 GHVP01062031.1:59-1132(-)
MPIQTAGYAVPQRGQPMVPHKYSIRSLREDDVHIKIHWSGVCHSDIHVANEDWVDTGCVEFPLVCGHEIVGLVEAIGSSVKKYKVGDKVGVGCLVGSCRKCKSCNASREQYCKHAIETYAGRDPLDNTPTTGGYSRDIVVPEHFVLRVPTNLSFKDTPPLLCAGITTYSPMKRWGADKGGLRIAILGLGGLGHMAIKFAKAWKNEVVVLSRSTNKEVDARSLGADHFCVTTNPDHMKSYNESVDLIIDTVSAEKPMNEYLQLLVPGGVLACVGMPHRDARHNLPPLDLILRNLTVGGSCIGGLAEHQEVLDFCGQHNITSTNEHIKFDQLNEAWTRVVKSDVKFRFVLDVLGSCPEA